MRRLPHREALELEMVKLCNLRVYVATVQNEYTVITPNSLNQLRLDSSSNCEAGSYRVNKKKEQEIPALFCFVRPARRTHLGVKVSYRPDRGNC